MAWVRCFLHVGVLFGLGDERRLFDHPCHLLEHAKQMEDGPGHHGLVLVGMDGRVQLSHSTVQTVVDDKLANALDVAKELVAVDDVRRHHPLVLDALLPSAHEGRIDDEHDPILGVGGASARDERTRERLLEVLPELNDLHVREEVGVDLVEQSALLLHREQGECRAAATCLVRLSRRIDTLLELDAHRPPLVELEVARSCPPTRCPDARGRTHGSHVPKGRASSCVASG